MTLKIFNYYKNIKIDYQEFNIKINLNKILKMNLNLKY